VHEPERSLSDILALGARPALYLLARLALLSGTFSRSQRPSRKNGRRRWTSSRPRTGLEAPTPRQEIAIIVARRWWPARGGDVLSWRDLPRDPEKHGASLTTLGVALFFAIAHVTSTFLPIFLIGLVVTYARAASGSLLPRTHRARHLQRHVGAGQLPRRADLSAASDNPSPTWIAAGLAATVAPRCLSCDPIRSATSAPLAALDVS